MVATVTSETVETVVTHTLNIEPAFDVPVFDDTFHVDRATVVITHTLIKPRVRLVLAGGATSRWGKFFSHRQESWSLPRALSDDLGHDVGLITELPKELTEQLESALGVRFTDFS